LSPWRRSLKVFWRGKPARVGILIVCSFILLALAAGWLAPVDPIVQDLDKKFIPPLWLENGLAPHLLGTDVLGRDVFARILYGARISLLIGFIAVFVGAAIGVPIGMVCGYAGGLIDLVCMRIMDIILAFPSVLLAICIVAILGPSLTNAMIAIGIVNVPTYARLVRACVLAERERDYIHAERALGQRPVFILFKAILPNVLSPLLVVGSLNFASAILEAAALSFIGLGAQPPDPEWGALLLEGKNHFYQAWWLILFPGIAILFTVIGFNLLGDGLRDALDPKATS